MIAVVRTWYSQRTLRERRLILAMSAIAVPLLAYLLLVAPLSTAYRASLQEHLAAVDRNGRVKALAERRSAPATRAQAVADLPLWLADSARQNRLTATAQGSADRATVAVERADASALFAWLAALEAAGHGLHDVRITPTPEGGVSAGFVVVGTRP